MSVARTVAQRSLCDRDQVGAVITTRANRIVATGYNGPPAGYPHSDQGCQAWCVRAALLRELPESITLESADAPMRDYSDCPSLHAEANALSVCDRSAREGGTIYVTSDVCFTCAKSIANSGLDLLVYRSRGERDQHRQPERTYKFLQQCGITVVNYGELQRRRG